MDRKHRDVAIMSDNWLNKVNWAQDGLVPVVAQESGSGRVLTVAWMNREALRKTVESGEVHYWSRSRKKLWHKGEESGHVQKVKAIRLDCDEDVILIEVEQTGGIACHTGRHSCFFQKLESAKWVTTDPVLKDPGEIYKKS
jgi:phosphoribosyl-AMP cyclohydrolase